MPHTEEPRLLTHTARLSGMLGALTPTQACAHTAEGTAHPLERNTDLQQLPPLGCVRTHIHVHMHAHM